MADWATDLREHAANLYRAADAFEHFIGTGDDKHVFNLRMAADQFLACATEYHNMQEADKWKFS